MHKLADGVEAALSALADVPPLTPPLRVQKSWRRHVRSRGQSRLYTWASALLIGALLVQAAGEEASFQSVSGAGRHAGWDPRTGQLYHSPDGRNWKPIPAVKAKIIGLAFGNGRFVAITATELLISSDGENFQSTPPLAKDGVVHLLGLAFGDGEGGPLFVLIGELEREDSSRVPWRASTTGGPGLASTASGPAAAQSIAYGSGHFVVTGPDGLIESSHDGQTWMRHPVAPGEPFSKVVWTGDGFRVSGGSAIWSSPDGLLWKRGGSGAPVPGLR